MLRSSCSWLSRNSSVSLTNAVRRLSSNHGNCRLASGVSSQTLRTCSHWLKKFSTSAVRARGSASMRRTCASSTFGVAQLAPNRQVEQLVVGNAAPQEERQARRQLDVGDAIGASPGFTPAGSASMRNRKSGLTSRRSSAARMPVVEVSVGAAALVEAEQRLDVFVRRRPAVRAPRQGRQNLRRARGLVRSRFGWSRALHA